MTDTTADGWTYNEDRDNILDQDGFAPDITTEQWRTLLHFIATHGPAIVAGRDPVAEAQAEVERLRARAEQAESNVATLIDAQSEECAAMCGILGATTTEIVWETARRVVAERDEAMSEVVRLRTELTGHNAAPSVIIGAETLRRLQDGEGE